MRKDIIPALIRAALLSALLLTLLLPACKKDDSSPVGPGTSVTELKANATLMAISRTQVQGTVFVTDQRGEPITGLSTSNFSAKLFYGAGIGKINADSLNGTVSVQTVSQAGKKIAVALTMDYSGSMFMGTYDTATQKYSRILDMENGVKAFVNQMTTGDILELIKFGSTVDFVFPFSSSRSLLTAAVDSASFDRGLTALYSSIYKGLQDASVQSSTTYARAVIAFTDGGENASTETEADVFGLAASSQIPVYTIGLIDSIAHSDPPGLNSYQEEDLVRIADTTGGLYYYAPSAAQLAQVYQQISGTLSNATQVTITWPTSGLPAAGTTVQVVITVTYNGVTTKIVKTVTML